MKWAHDYNTVWKYVNDDSLLQPDKLFVGLLGFLTTKKQNKTSLATVSLDGWLNYGIIGH